MAELTPDINEGPISREEMMAMFGEAMPMEAVQLIWTAPSEMTLAEIRRRLREIAAARSATSDLTKERIEEILAGCEGVTPGPWREGVDGNQRIYGPDNAGEASGLIASFVRRFDLSHITRLDPATVRTLCTLALKAEKYREALKPFADAQAALVDAGYDDPPSPGDTDALTDDGAFGTLSRYAILTFGHFRRARAAYEE